MEDVDNLMTWVNDSEVTGKFANFGQKFTREQEHAYIERILRSTTDKVFAIEDEQGTYLGNIGIHEIYWPSRVGKMALIMGNKQERGKGHAQRAIQELFRYAFEEAKLHKLWLIAFEDNKRALHIYQKVGFIEEGRLREEYILNGTYHTMVRMSILEREYFERRGAA